MIRRLLLHYLRNLERHALKKHDRAFDAWDGGEAEAYDVILVATDVANVERLIRWLDPNARGGLSMTMSKGERDQLLALVKKRERVMKTKAQERSATLLAEFDAQSAKVHHWDDDEVWARVKEGADAAIEAAQVAIAARCVELGIPPEFAPGLSMFWHGRGHNAVAERRAELRRAAKSRIEAIQRDAMAKIEGLSLDAQTHIIAHGLESDAAKAFLENMPMIESLMPAVQITDIQKLIEAKHAEHARRIDYRVN